MKCKQEANVLLEAHDLACVRGGRELFSGLSFTLRAGEALIVEGNNGSGKTSLLRILCGFHQPTAGSVTWCGKLLDRHGYRQQVSYIGHRSGVKPDLTVSENLAFSQRLTGTGSRSVSTETSEIQEAVRAVGLFRQRNLLTRKLSAGQKRRVAFARLQLEKRLIWVLDEPLTALDEGFVTKVKELLKKHLDQNGILILTTHRQLRIPARNIKRVSIVQPCSRP